MDSKISNLTSVTALDGADVLPIVNGGSTKKVTVTKIKEGLATTTYVDSQDATKENALGNPSTNGYVLSSSTAGVRTWVAQGGGVPYSGATANVDLGEFELKAGQLALDTTPTGTPAVGVTQWNDSLGSSQTTLKGGTVVLKNGVDLVARIVNKVTPNTTLTKANYQAVRVSGATGQRLSVELAQGDTDLNSADTIGLVTETIATNQEGFIITMGQIENINTTGSLQSETWLDGDVLYLSPTVAGRLTNIKPTGATGHIVVIGYVEYAHAINGKIYVKIMNGWELDELHNVYIDNALANEDFLQYESATQLWKNKPLTATLIRSKLGITTLSGSNTGDQDLSGLVVKNTAITGATKTKITYDSKGLVTNGQDASLNDLSDANISSPLADQVLVYDGLGEFRNGFLLSSSISNFNASTRSQVEAELVAGTNITITPSGTGATRQLTIASSGGGSSSQGAFTVLANNTNASAVPTEQVFKNIAEQTYTPTPVWVGTTAPSGTTDHSYMWSQVGNIVTLRINLSYSVAGSALTAVILELPSDLPTPETPSSVTVVNDVVNYGSGMLTGTKVVPASPTAEVCALRLKTLGTPNVFEIYLGRSSASHRYAYAFIQYFV
jgi:nitrogen fixation protein